MCDAITHRGPDDSGVWTDETGGSRSATAASPSSTSRPRATSRWRRRAGRYVIAFNGEVYNHLAAAPSTVRRVWRGHSDTETMLAAIERWGVEAAVRRFVGMFAFALWDREREEVTLVRDRLGIKPLYYGFGAGGAPLRLRAERLPRPPRLQRGGGPRRAPPPPPLQQHPRTAHGLPRCVQGAAGDDAPLPRSTPGGDGGDDVLVRRRGRGRGAGSPVQREPEEAVDDWRPCSAMP